jgi:hypothetical protein
MDEERVDTDKQYVEKCYANFDHLFPGNGFAGAKSGITDFEGRKTGLFKPV